MDAMVLDGLWYRIKLYGEVGTGKSCYVVCCVGLWFIDEAQEQFQAKAAPTARLRPKATSLRPYRSASAHLAPVA